MIKNLIFNYSHIIFVLVIYCCKIHSLIVTQQGYFLQHFVISIISNKRKIVIVNTHSITDKSDSSVYSNYCRNASKLPYSCFIKLLLSLYYFLNSFMSLYSKAPIFLFLLIVSSFSFHFSNFTFQIFPVFGIEMSASFISYFAHTIGIDLVWLL